jgi:acyl-CoA thioesterase
MDLDVAMTPALRERADDGRASFAWEVPDGWQQGKGAFGGLVAGALIGAGELALADPARPLRALTLEIMAPALVGATAIEVAPLRVGSSVTVMSAAMRQGDGLVAFAALTFGRERDDARWQTLAPPSLPPPSSMPVLPIGPPIAPVFTQHVEFRSHASTPFSGRVEPELTGWVRFRAPGAARGAAYLAACCDSYWPAALIALPAPRPMATLTFTLQIAGDLRGVDPDAPLAYRARSLAAGGGYVPELRELWTPDGRLVAVNPQTFALSR